MRAWMSCLAGALLLAPAAAVSAQSGAAPALAVQPLAGQKVPVLPVTFLTADAPIDELLPGGRAAQLASLTAMTNSRMVMIPAAVRFASDSTGRVRAEVAFVLADTRNGGVAWRSTPSATGTTPARALEAVIARILPDFR